MNRTDELRRILRVTIDEEEPSKRVWVIRSYAVEGNHADLMSCYRQVVDNLMESVWKILQHCEEDPDPVWKDIAKKRCMYNSFEATWFSLSIQEKEKLISYACFHEQ